MITDTVYTCSVKRVAGVKRTIAVDSYPVTDRMVDLLIYILVMLGQMSTVA